MQNINFLADVDPDCRNSILVNCDTRILLDHSNNLDSIPDMVSYGVLKESETEFLKSIKKHEFLLKMGSKIMVLRNEVSAQEIKVFTSKEQEVLEIEKKKLKLNSSVEIAIENLT